MDKKSVEPQRKIHEIRGVDQSVSRFHVSWIYRSGKDKLHKLNNFSTKNRPMTSEQSLESFLEALNDQAPEQRKHTLLLVRPSNEEYIQTLKSLYDYLQYKPTGNLAECELEQGVLNYTYIKPDVEEEPVEGYVEVYTIYDPSLKSFSLTRKLISILEKDASAIDVIVYIDALKTELTPIINSSIEDDSIMDEEIKKNQIIPHLHLLLDPFFNLKNTKHQWKSCNILASNTSNWIYKAATISVVDFVQQMLRSLLQQYYTDQARSRRGILVYFPFKVADSNDKSKIVWHHLLLQEKAPESVQPFMSNSPVSETIKYNDVFIDSKNDNFRNITLLDDTFEWTKCMDWWSRRADDTIL